MSQICCENMSEEVKIQIMSTAYTHVTKSESLVSAAVTITGAEQVHLLSRS